jgi:hypothetical protein
MIAGCRTHSNCETIPAVTAAVMIRFKVTLRLTWAIHAGRVRVRGGSLVQRDPEIHSVGTEVRLQFDQLEFCSR